jgi:hypothetical protein
MSRWPVTQRREQHADEHNHQAAKPRQQSVLDESKVSAHRRNIGPGRDVVMDRVEDHRGHTFGLGPLYAGILDRVRGVIRSLMDRA